MDIILIIVLIVGLIMRNTGRKTNDKGKEQLGNILAGVCALVLIIIWVSSCLRAI